ncbi:MAG TPA: phage tail tube protein [Arachnia sp.]|nr:phage tail tube protein [Arachnia sp.]
MARAQGARAQMALAFETVYGTPPASGFTKLPFASTTLGAEQPLLNSELLGYGRDPLAPIKDAVTADACPARRGDRVGHVGGAGAR